MKDFCNVPERDCIRLIVAQDLKESGIDIDSSTFSGGNMTSINTSHNQSSHNFNTLSSHHHGRHAHYLSTNNNLLNTSLNTPANTMCKHHHYHSHHHNNTNTLDSNHDSQLSSNATTTSCSTRTFGIGLKQLEMINITINEQILSVPW